MKGGGRRRWSHVIFLTLLAALGFRSAFVSPQTGNEKEMILDENHTGRLKVYVYDMPSRFNRKMVQKDIRCLSHMFAIELYMHLFLLSSPFRTMNPEEADWFYTPVYTSCELTKTGLPLIDNMPYNMRSAIKHISTRWKYWNRTDGADHFFVVPHDFGACFHFQEKMAIERGILPLLKRATLIQTFGQRNHPCLGNNSIIIPPYVSPKKIIDHIVPANTPRSTFVYFRGVFYDTFNDPDGNYYARGVRGAIWENFKDKALFDISSDHPETYYEDMQRSIFCLCPLGWAPWSPRIVEAVAFGCIPVIIADEIMLPFEDVIPWADIAVFVKETDVPKLDVILTSLSMEAVTMKQRLLQDPRLKRALLFPRVSERGDGFHQVMNALARRLPHPEGVYRGGGDSTLDWGAGQPTDFFPRRALEEP